MGTTDEELKTCPQCAKGKMRPLSYVATERDEDKGQEKSDVRAYKCDNCGYPGGESGGRELRANVTDWVGVSEDTTTEARKEYYSKSEEKA
jgi:hypothetical protein